MTLRTFLNDINNQILFGSKPFREQFRQKLAHNTGNDNLISTTTDHSLSSIDKIWLMVRHFVCFCYIYQRYNM